MKHYNPPAPWARWSMYAVGQLRIVLDDERRFIALAKVDGMEFTIVEDDLRTQIRAERERLRAERAAA
jgi:hypothetical protein